MRFMFKPLVAGMAAAALTFGFATTASAQTTTIKVSHQFPGVPGKVCPTRTTIWL